jgi:hypothetical protein
MKTHLPNPRTLLLSIFCLTLLIFSATAQQQTKKISLQGFLKDANGKAVADGAQEIIFKLYTTATGGNAEWTDTQTINVFGGVYSTHLGSTTNPVESLNWGSSTYYVGVTVQGTELTPRTELTFAPYSLGAPFAQKSQEVICSGAVGDIKHSILNPSQFAAVNGNCWVPMDGRALATTDRLRQVTGMTSLPNGGGLFIRSQEFDNSTNFDDDRTSSSPIASFQGENFKSHTHSGTTDERGGEFLGAFLYNSLYNVNGPFEEGKGNPDYGYNATNAYAPRHAHNLNINNNGGNETRPDNMNFWVYIRIN